MKINEIMTSPVITVNYDTTIMEVAHLMKEKNIGFVPVLKNNFLVGVITDRDIVVRALADYKIEGTVEEIMTNDPLYVSESDDVNDVAFKMARSKIRRMVVTKNGAAIGVVTTKGMLRNKEVIDYVIETYKNDNTKFQYQIFDNSNPHDSVKIDDFPL